MFLATEFENARKAAEYVTGLMCDFDNPQSMEYQIVHSLTEMECSEDGGDKEVASKILLDYIMDLDSMQGYMICYPDRGGYWDYMEWEDPDSYDDDGEVIYKPPNPDELYVYSGEGVVVIYNEYAVCEHSFPVIIVKSSFWHANSARIKELLHYKDDKEDYTGKISPAIYVELFYTDDENEQN
jgi:hypothetical protein